VATLVALFLISCLSYLSGRLALEFIVSHFPSSGALFLLFVVMGMGIFHWSVFYKLFWGLHIHLLVSIYLLPCLRAFLVYLF